MMGTRGDDPFDAQPARARLDPGWLVETETQRPAAPPAARWQRVADRLERVARRSLDRGTPDYPLAAARILEDLAPEPRALLAHRFRAETPRGQWGSSGAAWRHFERLLPPSRLRTWDDVRGVHVVLGAAGSGKTTLVLKLAATLCRTGLDVGIIGLFVERAAGQALTMGAAAHEIPATLAAVRRDWDAAWDAHARRDAVLVDTPCFVSCAGMPWQLLTLPELHRPGTHLHYVVCLHHRPEFVRRQMQLAAAHRIDALALTMLDLAPGIGPLVALQLERPRPIGFVHGDAAPEAPLGLGGRALLRRFDVRPD